MISFTVVTLIGSWLLTALGLPQDALRWIGLVVLGVVGLGLFFPSLGDLLEIPLSVSAADGPTPREEGWSWA